MNLKCLFVCLQRKEKMHKMKVDHDKKKSDFKAGKAFGVSTYMKGKLNISYNVKSLQLT